MRLATPLVSRSSAVADRSTASPPYSAVIGASRRGYVHEGSPPPDRETAPHHHRRLRSVWWCLWTWAAVRLTGSIYGLAVSMVLCRPNGIGGSPDSRHRCALISSRPLPP